MHDEEARLAQRAVEDDPAVARGRPALGGDPLRQVSEGDVRQRVALDGADVLVPEGVADREAEVAAALVVRRRGAGSVIGPSFTFGTTGLSPPAVSDSPAQGMLPASHSTVYLRTR